MSFSLKKIEVQLTKFCENNSVRRCRTIRMCSRKLSRKLSAFLVIHPIIKSLMRFENVKMEQEIVSSDSS